MNNTVKHAGARHIWIDFKVDREEQLKISYKDDGRGMPATPQKKKGMGMGNLESRLSMIGAVFSITTAPDKGFLMEALMPLPR
jgi:signal transduction histidine kinase